MKWVGVFSLTWWPCAVTALVFGCVLIIRWLNFGLSEDVGAESYGELFAQVGVFFNGSDAQGFLSNFRVGMIALGAGVTAMVSTGAGNIRKNVPCRRACKDAGWSQGRYRRNPHDTPASGPYECWCCKGKTWSPEPIPVEPSTTT